MNIFEFKPSGLNLHLLPVCQSSVHIGDSDQWVQVELSVCGAVSLYRLRRVRVQDQHSGGSIRVQQDQNVMGLCW